MLLCIKEGLRWDYVFAQAFVWAQAVLVKHSDYQPVFLRVPVMSYRCPCQPAAETRSKTRHAVQSHE